MNDTPKVNPRPVMTHALAPWDVSTIDIRLCDRIEICAVLLEHETAGFWPGTWPREARSCLMRHADAWINEHPDREVRAVSYAAPMRDGGQCVVMILHHARR
jgi:hypothetical protein